MNIRKTCLAVLTMAFVAACGPKPGSPTQAPASGAPPPAEAAGVASRDFGDYVVHFNARSTDELTPEVAKSYEIVRSKNRALLNVSIDEESARHDRPVRARQRRRAGRQRHGPGQGLEHPRDPRGRGRVLHRRLRGFQR